MNLGVFKLKKFIFILVIILILAGIGGYYYFQYQKSQKLLQDPGKLAVVENQALIEKVGKLIELPNEQPQIATVSDKIKLQNQPFFARAENGDKVLIYSVARKAILYRPSTNKIIEVSVLNVEVNQQPTASSPSATPSGTVTPSVTSTSTLTPTSTPAP